MDKNGEGERVADGSEVDQSLSRTQAWLLLLTIVVVATYFRSAGLRWGLPNEQHLFSYHPDELQVVGTAARLDLFGGKLNPHFFNYGSLFIYMVHVVTVCATGLGWTPPPDGLYLLARVLSALIGIGTVLLTYFLAEECAGRRAGIAAAMLLAVTPGHVVNSHYATVDVPATFLTTLSLLGAVKLIREPAPKWYVLAGTAAGLGAATKYNSVLLLPVIAVAHRFALRRRRKESESSPTPRSVHGLFALAFGCLAVAFVVGCPYSLLSRQEFWHDFSFEWRHVSQLGHGLLFERTGNGFLYHFAQTLPTALTWPLWLVCLGGLLGVTCDRRLRREPQWSVLVVWILLYFAVIGTAKVRFLRYVLPLVPPLLCLAGGGGAISWVQRRPLVLLFLLIFPFGGWALLSTYDQVHQFQSEDPRTQTVEWFEEHVPAGTTVGMLTVPWFWSPPLSRWNGGTSHPDATDIARRESRYDLRFTGWDAKKLEQEKPAYFVLSEFEWREENRLCADPEGQWHANRWVSQGQVDFWERLHTDYQTVEDFKGRSTLRPRGLLYGPRFVPHDWLYPSPEILVFRRVR